jgi:superfamily II DNA helicase RecQ
MSTTPHASTAQSALPDPFPSFSEIRSRTEKHFGVRPCLWQIQVADAVLRGGKDIASIARTGIGKTLTFWMPLLFRPARDVQIIVTPLNILGKQNVAALAKAGFKAIFISADTATAENFRVSFVTLMHTLKT